KTVGSRPESFHLIGHSLGAHIAGYAGERLHKLGRISGLDPAGPFFRNVPEIVRLDPSDAVFVDVIHSNPAPSVLRGFGSPEDSGDLDFFPGGGNPPGCEQTFARSLVEDLPTEVSSLYLDRFEAHGPISFERPPVSSSTCKDKDVSTKSSGTIGSPSSSLLITWIPLLLQLPQQ
ncbi:Pancreatic lipase-related protein 2, partial [Araneus ventricosus]